MLAVKECCDGDCGPKPPVRSSETVCRFGVFFPNFDGLVASYIAGFLGALVSCTDPQRLIITCARDCSDVDDVDGRYRCPHPCRIIPMIGADTRDEALERCIPVRESDRDGSRRIFVDGKWTIPRHLKFVHLGKTRRAIIRHFRLFWNCKTTPYLLAQLGDAELTQAAFMCQHEGCLRCISARTDIVRCFDFGKQFNDILTRFLWEQKNEDKIKHGKERFYRITPLGQHVNM